MAGRVQNLKPWQKGQPSPNPKGRPRKSIITEAIRELLGTECTEDNLGRTYAELIALALVKRALKGDVQAIRELADRTEGKPRQIQASEPGGLNVQVQHMSFGNLPVPRFVSPRDLNVAPAELVAENQNQR